MDGQERLPPVSISRAQLEEEASKFLAKHNPGGRLPVPIEEIVEFDLQMRITPMPGLRRTIGADAFLACSCEEIVVDQGSLESEETRYRFTLAEETSHKLLHRDFFDATRVASLEDYLEWFESQDQRLIYEYDRQARDLAGRILVPTPQLLAACRPDMKRVRDQLKETRHSWRTVKPWGQFASRACRLFNVHPTVVEIRLGRDGVGARLKRELEG